MPSFKSMEISKELSNDNRLSIKNSLFGILSKVTYQPTHSKIVSKIDRIHTRGRREIGARYQRKRRQSHTPVFQHGQTS